jgi:hypothetical protein
MPISVYALCVGISTRGVGVDRGKKFVFEKVSGRASITVKKSENSRALISY